MKIVYILHLKENKNALYDICARIIASLGGDDQMWLIIRILCINLLPMLVDELIQIPYEFAGTNFYRKQNLYKLVQVCTNKYFYSHVDVRLYVCARRIETTIIEQVQMQFISLQRSGQKSVNSC